nr:hypothetical protein Iba_chr10fCG10800 [Ipomoea batatas]
MESATRIRLKLMLLIDLRSTSEAVGFVGDRPRNVASDLDTKFIAPSLPEITFVLKLAVVPRASLACHFSQSLRRSTLPRSFWLYFVFGSDVAPPVRVVHCVSLPLRRVGSGYARVQAFELECNVPLEFIIWTGLCCVHIFSCALDVWLELLARYSMT